MSPTLMLERPRKPAWAQMRQAASQRVLIVGGGMAGSLLALVLGRAGHEVCLIDLRRRLAPAFRNEKLGVDQIAHLRKLGALSCFEEACYGSDARAPDPRRPPMKDCGARYDRWIAHVRDALPDTVRFVEGKVDRIETSDHGQAVVLGGGERIEGRLVVLATGRGERLRTALGVTRRTFSERHSTCLGFSVVPRSGDCRQIKAEIFSAPFGSGHAYATVFPMLEEVRVNVFSYRDIDDPWVRDMRADPIGTLSAALPALAAKLRDTALVRELEARSTDLYAVEGHVQPGLVLLGDAFHAPCPASGTGMTRILSDVDRLANVYVPRWLATPGMARAKIAAFYADPVKRQVDAASLRRSLQGRLSATSKTPYWRLRRALSRLRRQVKPELAGLQATAA
jgi:2-polyprenyl-6-methoxyphenol hydroxylase-like FAD-dependent oxidoreductase